MVLAKAVDFELPDLDGKTHKLSDYRGKWVVVNYWATWCPPCLEEMPELEVFHNNNKETKAVVLGVNLEQIEVAKLKTFVDEQFISYPILREKPALYTSLGRVPGMPTSFIIGPDGRLVKTVVGKVTSGDLEQVISGKVATVAEEEGTLSTIWGAIKKAWQ